MTSRQEDKRVEAELAAMLEPRFPGMTVTVAYSERWNRKSVTFRWSGFAGLLPEERFHRLTGAIPEDFRASQMAGVVWLELAPEETIEDYLDLPRSEDVADKERDIYVELARHGFFELLGSSLGPSPETRCEGGFSATTAVLSQKGFPAAKIRDAKLVFIQHGVYCDCQVLQMAQPALVELHAGAA